MSANFQHLLKLSIARIKYAFRGNMHFITAYDNEVRSQCQLSHDIKLLCHSILIAMLWQNLRPTNKRIDEKRRQQWRHYR
ncbi:uncharacterized protein PHALS_15170 [Plasmopara halstedii]|uniref:Uncharacterized protein n=1 Tax=Plasmopara halstedii TaxID=4781 RepID=A0A0P1B3Q1_PLAHL|nr:uncharacterized protein PHALS_15170 [Plasmopara halstedii]CEG48714.1 hypothetical protein PHALS_15170 [Plasmopara halstedii]|eukprot:XP_024585083.1 hypothetical protein PHALS_15170 [Plasmopara halstedii]